jgi:hypothetical protein
VRQQQSRTGGHRNIYCESKNPCLGGYPWLENNEQPKGTVASLSEEIGYVEYIDMVKLSSLLSNDPRHVYLVAQQAVSYIHPCQFCT